MTHKCFYNTHTHVFTRHSRSYTQTRLHTSAFTHRPFTHKHFCAQIQYSAGPTKVAKNHQFSHSNLISCKRVAAEASKSQFYISILMIEPYRTPFRAKRLPLRLQNRNFTSAFDDRTSFRPKGLPTLQNRNFTSVFNARASFSAKGLPRKRQNHINNFTSVFDDRTSFRAKRWPFGGALSAPPAA